MKNKCFCHFNGYEVKDAAAREGLDLANARLGNLVANSGEQTEGNAELIDIRTAADGTVYPTAGDSVRGQISYISGFNTVNVNKVNNYESAYSSKITARDALPTEYRKQGVIICYLLSDGWHTEVFKGTEYASYEFNWEEMLTDKTGIINDLFYPEYESGTINYDGTNYVGSANYDDFRTDYIEIDKFVKIINKGDVCYVLLNDKKELLFNSGWLNSNTYVIDKAMLSENDVFSATKYIRFAFRGQQEPIVGVVFGNSRHGWKNGYYIRVEDGAVMPYSIYAYNPNYIDVSKYKMIKVNEGYEILITEYDEKCNMIKGAGGWVGNVFATPNLKANAKYVRLSVRKISKTDFTNSDDIGLYLYDSLDLYEKHISTKRIVSNPKAERVAHGSYCCVDTKNDYMYTVYYAGETADTEYIYDTDINVKLCRQSISEPCDKTIITVLDKGENVGDFTQSSELSPYDPCVCSVDDDTLRIWFVGTPDSNASDIRIVYRDVNKSDLSLGKTINSCTLTYNSESYLMNLHELGLFADVLRGTALGTHNLGTYPVLNGVKKIGDYYYSILTFISSVSDVSVAPCIIRSQNGLAWEYVNSLPNSYDTKRMWEVGWDFNGDVLYMAYRACDDNYIPCFAYSLTDNTYSEEVKLLENGNGIDDSRPALFYQLGMLYIAQNVYPKLTTVNGYLPRTRVKVLKTNTTFKVISDRDLVNVDGCSYFSFVNMNGNYHLMFSEDYRHNISYSKGNIAISDITDFVYSI